MAPTLELDHALLAVADLEAAAADLLERHGLASVAGGRHPAWGTANRIVPLGSTYLELIGVVEPAVAARANVGRWVASTTPGRPMGWVVRTDDIDAVCARLGLEATEGSRTTPDGRTLRWRTAGIDEAAREPTLPFFIEWAVGVEHPGAARADHRVDAPRLAGIALSGDADRLKRWLGGASLPVAIAPGPAGVRSVVIVHGGGEIVL